MTANERKQIDALRAELEAVKAENDAAYAAIQELSAPGDLADITRTGLSAAQLAVRSLMLDSGWSQAQAEGEVLAKGAGAFEPEIKYQTEQVNLKLDAEFDEAWDATPEGVRFAAENLEYEDEQRARTLQLARRLLEDQGFAEADLEALSDHEILQSSGIEAQEQPGFLDGASDWNANVAAINAAEAKSEASLSGSDGI